MLNKNYIIGIKVQQQTSNKVTTTIVNIRVFGYKINFKVFIYVNV